MYIYIHTIEISGKTAFFKQKVLGYVSTGHTRAIEKHEEQIY